MKIAFLLLCLACSCVHAQQSHFATMKDGALDLLAPEQDAGTYRYNLRLANGGFYVQVQADWAWAGIAGDTSILQSNFPNWGLITPFASGTVYIGGNLEVGLPAGFGSGDLRVNGHVDLPEQSAPPAPGANTARVFARDNGSGKTQLCVLFPTGAVQVLATQP
jgi:hypothetical protein